jgi:hypothetical protein
VDRLQEHVRERQADAEVTRQRRGDRVGRREDVRAQARGRAVAQAPRDGRARRHHGQHPADQRQRGERRAPRPAEQGDPRDQTHRVVQVEERPLRRERVRDRRRARERRDREREGERAAAWSGRGAGPEGRAEGDPQGPGRHLQRGREGQAEGPSTAARSARSEAETPAHVATHERGGARRTRR